MMIVCFLTVLLSGLLSVTWMGLCRPAADVSNRACIAQEANLAAASFVRDLCGYLANPEGRVGPKNLYPFVGRMQPGGTQLWLCFDGGASPNGIADWGKPDTVIIYYVQGTQLIRWDQTANTIYVVANHVSSMQVQPITNPGNGVLITLTMSYWTTTQTYSLVALDP
jgi:hypothetical protein